MEISNKLSITYTKMQHRDSAKHTDKALMNTELTCLYTSYLNIITSKRVYNSVNSAVVFLR